MAKSLRSKSKRAFRRIKREDPKSDYAVRDKIRVARLSEKLKAIKDVSDSEQEEDTANDGDMEVVADSTQGAKAELKAEEKDMTLAGDGTAPTESSNGKVSTHGPKDSARLDWRKKRGLPAGRKRTEKNSTTFAKPKSFKSTGKAKKKGRI